MRLKRGDKFHDRNKKIMEITKITGYKNNLIEFNNNGNFYRNEVINYVMVGMLKKI